MTRTERPGLIALIERQRRYEWELARDEQTRVASKLVAGKTHDLLNLVQIVTLAAGELHRRCDAAAGEFIDDLTRAAAASEASLGELMAIARPDPVAVRGAPVGAVLTRVVGELRGTLPIELHLAIAPATTTALGEDELAHLVLGLALDAADAPRIELLVRDRRIGELPWVELVRGTELPPAEGERFDLRAVALLLARGGGELSASDRRGGGSELIAALPATSN